METIYYERIITVGELTKRLYEMIGQLSVLSEDEIVTSEIKIRDTESCINDIVYDRDSRTEEAEEELIKKLNTVPPHIIHNYFISSKDNAETDGYWENMYEAKSEYWYDKIVPLIESREEEEIPERTVAQEEEVDLDQFVDY